MTWTLLYAEPAEAQFAKLDKSVQRSIKKYMAEVCSLENPKARGKPLESNLAGLHRYRIADWRVIALIENTTITMTVVKLGHRSKVYD